MVDADVRVEIDRQLESLVGELEADFGREGRVNRLLFLRAGEVVGLLVRPDLSERLRANLPAVTRDDLLAGALTDIELDDAEAREAVPFTGPAESDRRHPACDDATLLAYLGRTTEPHLVACVRGDAPAATHAATTRLTREDVGAALAVLGRFGEAAEAVRQPPADESTREHVRLVVLLESCRRRSPGYGQAVRRADLRGYGRVDAALALARRLTWAGYPLGDW